MSVRHNGNGLYSPMLGPRPPLMTLTVALSFAVMGMASGGTTLPRDRRCELPESTSTWIQEVLDGWARVSAYGLRLKPVALPWMVLFDAECTWHLSPNGRLPTEARVVSSTLSFAERPVTVQALPTQGEVLLPDGQKMAASPVASTGLYRSGKKAFFVLALPAVWRADPRQADTPDLDRFLQGVIAHELAHTRHLAPLLGRIKRIAKRHRFDNLRLDDDVIQTRFENTPGFRLAVEAERDRLFDAVAESNPAARARLLAQALALSTERRRTHFIGSDEVYSELEDVFLALEGVGQWAALALARDRSPKDGDERLISFVRDNRRFWSQEVGFAQALVLEKMVPAWQRRVLGPDLVAPRLLLEEAVARFERRVR